MTTIDRRSVLDALETTELRALVYRYGLGDSEVASRDRLLALLVESEAVTLGQMLVTLPRTRLKELCRDRGLSDSGREKSLLALRLLGVDPSAPPPPKPVPPIIRRRRPPGEGD